MCCRLCSVCWKLWRACSTIEAVTDKTACAVGVEMEVVHCVLEVLESALCDGGRK